MDDRMITVCKLPADGSYIVGFRSDLLSDH